MGGQESSAAAAHKYQSGFLPRTSPGVKRLRLSGDASLVGEGGAGKCACVRAVSLPEDGESRQEPRALVRTLGPVLGLGSESFSDNAPPKWLVLPRHHLLSPKITLTERLRPSLAAGMEEFLLEPREGAEGAAQCSCVSGSPRGRDLEKPSA